MEKAGHVRAQSHYHDCVVHQNVTDSALIAILKSLHIGCTYFLINTIVDIKGSKF